MPSCLLSILAAIALSQASPAPFALPLPEGTVKLECEELEDSSWHRYADAEASGGAKLLANRADWVAEGAVQLPPGARYTVWVRSRDNGHYVGRYHYHLTISGRERRMADVEPLGHEWVWEKWGQLEPGNHTIRLDRADHFPAMADCILFTPDPSYRPSGRPLVDVSAAGPAILPRRGASVRLSFTANTKLADQKLFCALRAGLTPVWVSEVQLPEPAARWRIGEPITVTVDLPELRFVAPGRYEFFAELSGCEYADHEEGDFKVTDVELGPWDIVPPCKAAIRPHQGAPALFINGEPVFGFMFLGVGTKRYHEFAATGGHLYSVGCGIGNVADGQFDAAAVDRTFQTVLEEDPAALILPRIGATAPEWWLQANPDQRVIFDDGSPGPQSMASENWLTDIGAHLRAFVRHVRNSPYADRVIGFHICSGESAEWQAWGMWSERRGDFSLPMRRAFAAWLEAKYEDPADLARAWGVSTPPDLASADGVPIPSRADREKPGRVLLDPTADQRTIDFFEFYPTVASRAIRHFARIARDASDDGALVGYFYGYAPQYGPIAPESQHLDVRSVLDCPDIDFLCSPAMYSDRQPGGTTNFMSFTDSIRLRGKYWFDEADIRTHLQENEVGRCEDMPQTLGVLQREYAAIRAHQVGMWWFEMSDGWFSAPEIHDLFTTMRTEGVAALSGPAPVEFRPEIGVFFHEKSAFRQAQSAGSFYHFGLTAQIAALRRVGAPVAVHLLSDLGRGPDYKLNILLNATDLNAAERALIDSSLKRDRKTVLFVHAPGFGRVDGRGTVTEDLAGIEELTGMGVEMLAQAGPIKARLAADDPLCGNPVLIDTYGGADGQFGPNGEYAPRFTIADPSARTLARDSANRPLMAHKVMPGWTSVYSATPGVPPGIIRNLAAEAGAHIFADQGDAFYAGAGTVAIHAREPGAKVIRLPGRFDVRELFGEKRVWGDAGEVTVQLDAAGTAVLAVTPAEPGD